MERKRDRERKILTHEENGKMVVIRYLCTYVFVCEPECTCIRKGVRKREEKRS